MLSWASILCGAALSAALAAVALASLGSPRELGSRHMTATTSPTVRCSQMWPNSRPASCPVSHTSTPAAAVVARP